MKVDIVNQNCQAKNNAYNILRPSGNKMSFTGASAMEKAITETLHHKNILAGMKKLEWLKGEIGGILITALGTGAVAPIFIGFNPFVKPKKDATPEEKEDVKNTKLYTAMRQPISAALAILFQASIQKYIDKGLDAIFNNPKYSKHVSVDTDRSAINTKTYINDIVEKEMSEQGKSKPSYIRTLFSSKAKEERKAYQEAFDARVDEINSHQIQEVANNLELEGKIKIGERYLDTKTTAELVNKQIDSYVKDARALQKTPQQINFYANRAEVLINNEGYLRKLFKDVPLAEIKAAPLGSEELKNLYSRTTEIVQDLLAKEENEDIKTILREILNKPEDLRANRIDRTFQRIASIKKLCPKGFDREKYKKALITRNSILEDRIIDLEHSRIKRPHEADEKLIKRVINDLAKNCKFDKEDTVVSTVLKDTDTFGTSITKLKEKIFKDVAKSYKKFVEESYKSVNQFTKIGIGVLITLPITCTALNWVYPRFMELFFPKLAGVKKDKAPEQVQQNGGDK